MKDLYIPDGMYFFEYVLMVLGIIFFVCLLIILIIFTFQKRSLKQLFLLFLLSIIMIGYPSIQKITYDNGVLSIEKYNNLLANSPQDSIARKELEKTLEKIEKRTVTNPQTLTKLGQGYAILGDTLKAIDLLDGALLVDSNFKEAKDMQQKYNTRGVKIDRLTIEVTDNPDNQQAKTVLKNEINILENVPSLNDISLQRIINSSAALGDTVRVMRYIDSLKANTQEELNKVNNLRKRFGGNRIDR